MQLFWQDLCYGARLLKKTPGFTVVAVCTLALGLALTATTMSVVNAYLIRAMPYPAANRLYHVFYVPQGQPEPRGLAALDWRELDDIIELADNSTLTRFLLTDNNYLQEAQGLLAASGSLEALGVRATLGRSLLEEDYRADAERVALIGQSLWRERFGGDPEIIGRYFRAHRSNQAEPDEVYRIVGVLPSEFRYVREYVRGPMEFVVPLRLPLQPYLVRLREGVPAAYAQQRLTEAVSNVATSLPSNWDGVHLESVHARYVTGLRPMLMAITTAASLVLLIVCANVSVLTLLRALRRQKEMAVRVALGARRWDLARMLMAEACLLCAAALIGGLALTKFALTMLAPLIEEQLGRSAPGGTAAIALDSTVLLIVGGAGILMALSLSLLPILTPWQRRLADTLRREGRSGTDSATMRRMRSSLIILEIAASLALLVSCGLMIRSVLHLVNTDLGFQTAHILRSRIALPVRTYPDAAAFLRFYDRFNERLRAESDAPFAMTNFIPFYEGAKQALEIEGGEAGTGKSYNPGFAVGVLAVSDGYFDLLRIGIKQGRGFTAADRLGTEPVAIISETLARRLWPDGNAVGRHIRTSEQPVANAPLTVWRTIVGVAHDARQTYVDEDLKDIYLPFSQAPNRYAPLFFRTDHPRPFSLETLRAAVAEIDTEVLVTGEMSFESEGNKLLAGPRFLMATLTGFALFAALLAILGIYGVTAYGVQQREREVAIRMALGATPGAVIRLFLKEGGLVLTGGLIGGLLGTRAVSQLLASQLFGVQPFDLSTLLTACAFIVVAGLLAIWWPARRAANRNPLAALNEN